MNIECEGNSLKIGKLINAFLKYKWTNILILLTFLALGMLYYLMQSPIYGVSASVEVKNVQHINRDFFGNAIGNTAGLETEIDIIRSNMMIEKTLKSVGYDVHYYHDKGRFSTEEVYKTTPFIVKNFIVYNPKLYGRKISIVDLGKGKFSLSVERSLKERVVSFITGNQSFKHLNRVYHFNKVYANNDIAFKIVRTKVFTHNPYMFSLETLASTISKIKKNLKITPASTDSNVLKFHYKDAHAQKAKDFLNKLIDNYVDYSVKDLTIKDRKQLQFVNDQLDKINQALAQSENSLEGFKVHNNISDIQAQMQEVIGKIGVLEDKLQEEESSYNSILLVDSALKKGHYSVISSLEERYPVLATMVQNLEALLQRREALLVNLTQKHPDVISVTKSIINMESSITHIVEGIKKDVLKRKESLKTALFKYKKILKEFPTKEKELARHERVFQVNDHVYNYLLQKQSELSIEKVSHTSNKHVIDYAKIAKKLNLKLPFILAMSILLGLFTMLLHTILRMKFDIKIKTPDDVTENSDIPLYGIIPFVKDKENYNSAYVLEDASSTASEAFRAVRTNLDYIIAPNGSKVILVTSSIPNEGKTAVAANLASIIGMGEKKVIILSLDLRRPEMHHKFGLSNKIGMSDVLSQKAALKDVIWEHELYPNLNIITSGRIPPNPAELLASERMKKILDELKKEYDYIILDTPPINYVADAIALFKYADENLFVIKSDFTEKKHLEEINRLTEKLGLENCGIILNSVKEKYNKLEQFDYKYLYYEPL